MARTTAKTTLTTTVYNHLRSAILQGALRPGQKLRIDALAEKYEVGNNAVREALSRLAAERLVDRHDQRGFSVPSIALEEWRELVRSRVFLEEHMLRSSMARRTPDWEEAVVVAYHRLARLRRADAADRSEWEDAHRGFHRALISNGDSRFIIDFCDVLADQAIRYISISNGYHTISRDGRAEHEDLMKAALYGTEDEAAALLRAHYALTLRNLELQFPQDTAAGSGATD